MPWTTLEEIQIELANKCKAVYDFYHSEVVRFYVVIIAFFSMVYVSTTYSTLPKCKKTIPDIFWFEERASKEGDCLSVWLSFDFQLQ